MTTNSQPGRSQFSLSTAFLATTLIAAYLAVWFIAPGLSYRSEENVLLALAAACAVLPFAIQTSPPRIKWWIWSLSVFSFLVSFRYSGDRSGHMFEAAILSIAALWGAVMGLIVGGMFQRSSRTANNG